MKRAYDAVDHPELDRLIAILGADPERDRLAAASAEANAQAAALGAELDSLTARAAEVTGRIGAGVANHADRVALAKARAAIEAEALFAPGRLEAVTAAKARAELAYLAAAYHAVRVAERAARDDHDAAHRVWAGPAIRAEQLAGTTYPQHDAQRAALAEALPPLAQAKGAAARRLAALQELQTFLIAFTDTRYGPGVDLANQRAFDRPVAAFVARVVDRWRAARAA